MRESSDYGMFLWNLGLGPGLFITSVRCWWVAQTDRDDPGSLTAALMSNYRRHLPVMRRRIGPLRESYIAYVVFSSQRVVNLLDVHARTRQSLDMQYQKKEWLATFNSKGTGTLVSYVW